MIMRRIQPHILCGLGDVAKYVLLPGHVQRAKLIAEHFDKYKKVAENREFVTYTGTYKGIPVSVTSTGIGGPSASIAVEELANIGGKVFIRVGTTGSLQKDIDIGDIVIAAAAVRSEGTSLCYVPPEYPAIADLQVTSALIKASKKLGVKHYVGIVWSYDAFYAESQEKVRRWSEARVLSVDCESAPIFIIASLRGLKAGSIMAVDGNLIKGTKKGEIEVGEERGEFDQRVKRAIEMEIRVALEAVKILHELDDQP
ncbi:nucleoside phosphorylase [Candidatus Bathyarchaeota archaeon]|nr:MAG: nucleoside phosphorylase [Candidatus Bathyarchaeota archaeon]